MVSSLVVLNYLCLKNVGTGSLLSTNSIKVIGSEIYEGEKSILFRISFSL